MEKVSLKIINKSRRNINFIFDINPLYNFKFYQKILYFTTIYTNDLFMNPQISLLYISHTKEVSIWSGSYLLAWSIKDSNTNSKESVKELLFNMSPIRHPSSCPSLSSFNCNLTRMYRKKHASSHTFL